MSDMIIEHEIENEETREIDLPTTLLNSSCSPLRATVPNGGASASSPNTDAEILLSSCSPLRATGPNGSASASDNSSCSSKRMTLDY